MKRILYILLFVCAATGVRCTEGSESPANLDYEKANYTSYWYYNYEALDIVDYETLGLETATQFKPGPVAHRGDTLFVANIGAPSGLLLFSKKSMQPLKTIKTWTAGGTEKSFADNSPIYAIAPTADRVYVSEKSSLIHVFALPDMTYYSCIGTTTSTTTGVNVMNVQALTVKDGLLYTRDKNGLIGIYKEELITPETYQKVTRYKQAGPGAGDSSNNGFATHYMEADAEGHILLTGYNAKSIRVLDPSLIDDDFVNGTNIDIDDLTWTLTFNPKTFAMTADRLYATGSNNAINIYDFNKKEWVNALKSVKGYSFTTPERIYREDDQTLWVSDISKCALVKVGIFRGEIREYSRVNDRIVKVESIMTRSGEEAAGGFYVDLRTHEIVGEAEIE